MGRRQVDLQPSLFDAAASTVDVAIETQNGAPVIDVGHVRIEAAPSWREVPQALFLSWSEPRQMAYCAARDDNSALLAIKLQEDPTFYQDRARAYRA